MKRKHLSILLTASLLALSAAACGKDSESPSTQGGLEITPIDEGDDTGETDLNETDTNSPENEGTSESSDTAVTNSNAPVSESAPSPASVTASESHDEYKADDGTVLLTNDVSMPVVSIEGAEDIAAKINANIEEYYTIFYSGDEETLAMAKSDYESRQGDADFGTFYGYTNSTSFRITRMDDKALSLEITAYSDTGGAHGNYGCVGKNYDLKTGELIGFDDLSEDSAAFHATVLDYMVNLAQTPSYKERLFEPSKNDLDSALFDREKWIFTQSGISLFADPYALGPYAAGEIYFRLPYEKAYELGLKENYHYSGNFTEERYDTSQYDPNTMEMKIDGTPEYSFDLNGDGTPEGIAFYGLAVNPEDGSQTFACYIDGTDWSTVLEEQLGERSKHGYVDSTYALYDMDSADGLTEIAVLFTEFSENPDADSESREYTLLFRYTKDKELQFLEQRDGFVTEPPQP